MSWTYACPKCGAMLNPDETIVLIGDHLGRRVLVGFSPKPGDYRVHMPPGVEVKPGDVWGFYCPVCAADLKTGENEALCSIKMVVSDKPFLVLFSRIAGEKATFVVTEKGVEQQHGEHADAYLPHLVQMKYLL